MTDETITGSDPKNANPLLKGEKTDVPHRIEGAFNLITTSVKRANPTHTGFGDHSQDVKGVISEVYSRGTVNFLAATWEIKQSIQRPEWLSA